MPIPDGRMRGIRSIRERDFLLGRVRSWHDSTAQPTILQSTHEAALDVVDLAAAARRILTCTRLASRRFWALTRRAGNETDRAAANSLSGNWHYIKVVTLRKAFAQKKLC